MAAAVLVFASLIFPSVAQTPEEIQRQSLAMPTADQYAEQQRQSLANPVVDYYEQQHQQSLQMTNETANAEMQRATLAAPASGVYGQIQAGTLAAPSAYGIGLYSRADLGTYLVSQNGTALYYFTADSPGMSNCTGDCLTAWPPFYAGGLPLAPELNSTDFTTITRPDGIPQMAFRGWPLYTYQPDLPGEARGQGINNAWYIVNPSAFTPP